MIALVTEQMSTDLAIAAILAIAGIGLLLLEFFIVSAGLLALVGIVCAILAIVIAFSASTAIGTGALLVLPLGMILIAKWGLRRMQDSNLVPQTVIDDNAGYQHRATELGIESGSVGTLVTAARPTGRARFAAGECDVSVVGSPLDAGASVRVTDIDGPTIFVSKDTSPSSSLQS